MWTLYDELISGIPGELTVLRAHVGVEWTMIVNSAGGVGLAMTMTESGFPSQLPETLSGLPLRRAAELVKSWNFCDASFGAAAINSFYNTPEHASALCARFTPEDPRAQDKQEDAFIAYQPLVAGKRVAVIGHFPYLERRFAPICTHSILERAPRPGDYPDSACEFILPEQDFVFITGVTLTNKTLPRLLQLSRNSHVVLVGPSTPLSEAMLNAGVNALCGFVAGSEEAVRAAVLREGDSNLFHAGTMVRILKP